MKQYNFATDLLKFFWHKSNQDEKEKFGTLIMIVAFECNNWLNDEVCLPKTYYEFSKKYNIYMHRARKFYLFLESKELIIKTKRGIIFNKREIDK